MGGVQADIQEGAEEGQWGILAGRLEGHVHHGAEDVEVHGVCERHQAEYVPVQEELLWETLLEK